jgi:hypothetical protein
MSVPETPPPPPSPREQLPITLFESVVLAVRADDARIYLSLRDLCDALGLAVNPQRRRILLDESLFLIQLRVLSGGQFRTIDFLLLEDVSIWLLSVQRRRVTEKAQERFSYVKAYLVTAVQRAFADLTGLPTTSSSDIEDLSELDRIDRAFTQLTELTRRQDIIEQSQDRARGAYRDLHTILSDLRDRMRALEQRLESTLSPSQRGTIYHMVQRWGTARAEHGTNLVPGVAIRKSWSELNEAFNVGTYTDLPAARYDEIVGYIKDQYRAVTGRDLDAVEQIGLEMEGGDGR